MHSHHAYYIEGPLSDFARYQAELHPYWASAFEKFGVDDARELSSFASLKNIQSEAVYLIGVSSITVEAQQALLKLLEEPQIGTVFVFLVPHGTLIPTVKSRMLPYPVSVTSRSNLEGKQFLKASHTERTEIIATLLKDEEGVKEKTRDLLNALEAELSKNIKDPKAREGLMDIAKVRNYVGDRSPSLKMLLEHLALCLPTN